MIDKVMQEDLILSYPYEQMTPFLQLIKEAALDPRVLSIKMTIYRLASKAALVDYLRLAAENGKVTVLMELRARFDEANNINWSESLEEAGCTHGAVRTGRLQSSLESVSDHADGKEEDQADHAGGNR